MSIISNSGRNFFSAYSVLATPNTGYVYNSEGDTDSEAGWIPCKSDEICVAFATATLTATTLLMRIEGRFDTYNRSASLYAEEVTSAQTIDKIVRIPEKVKEVRVGVRTDAVNILVASPNIFYAGLCLSESQ